MTQKKIEKNLIFSLIEIFICFSFVIGSISYIFSLTSSEKYKEKKYDESIKFYKISNILLIVGLILGILKWILVIGCSIILTNSNVELPNNIYNDSFFESNQISLNDKQYTLPISMNEFLNDNIFKIGTDIDTTYLSEKEKIDVDLWDDNLNTIGNIQIYNNSIHTKNIKECYVIGISLDLTKTNINIDYNSITNISTLSNIYKILGKNKEIDNNYNWNFDNDINIQICFKDKINKFAIYKNL